MTFPRRFCAKKALDSTLAISRLESTRRNAAGMLSGKDDSKREPSHMYTFAHFYRIFSPPAHLYRPRISYVDDCRGDLTIPDASMQILASRKFPRRVSRDRQSSIFCDTSAGLAMQILVSFISFIEFSTRSITRAAFRSRG